MQVPIPNLFKNILVFVAVAEDETENEEMVAALVKEAEDIGLVLWYAGSSQAEGQDETEIEVKEAESQPQ